MTLGSTFLHRCRRACWAALLVLLLGYGLQELTPHLPFWLSRSLPWWPAPLWTVAILLSAGFNQSRLCLLSLSSALIWTASSTLLPTAWRNELAQHSLLLVLPLNLVILTWLGGRGLWSRPALKLWVLLAAEAGLWYALNHRPEAAASKVFGQLLHLHWMLPNGWALSLIALLYGLAAVVLIGIALARGRATEALAPAYLLCGWLALSYSGNQPASYWTWAALFTSLVVLVQAYGLAYVDALTDLKGRRALEDYGRQLGRNYAVAMVDVDHFKSFNDTYGHDVGDQVLKMVAARLRSVRAGGRAFRYGGEEFTLVFNHDDREQILEELERLRGSIEASQFSLRGKDRPPAKKGKRQRGRSASAATVQVTVSMGMALRQSPKVQHKTLGEVLKAADQALYKAKNKGRNRVEAA